MMDDLGKINLPLGIVTSVFALAATITQLSVFLILLIVFSLVLFFILYHLFRGKSKFIGSGIDFKYNEFRASTYSWVALYTTLVIIVGICGIQFFLTTTVAASGVKNNTARRFQESKTPCQADELADRSICIAKFSTDNFDDFSQSLILDLSGKTDTMHLNLIDLNQFVYSGRDEKKQIDSIKIANCIDTGIIVHGIRSKESEVFYCKVHFLNYQRQDTLIKNPEKIEFTFDGHIAYLSNFLLAQNESSQQKYRYALNLFLDSKKIGTGDDFNSIVDYYIGNMYYNLNKLDSARIFYERASLKPSTIQDYALNKLAMSQPKLNRYEILKISTSEETPQKRRSKINGLLNSQFRSYSSSYFRVKYVYEDSVQFGNFVQVTPDEWLLGSSKSHLSKWLLLRYDSLYYFEMTSRIYDESSEVYMFSAEIKKKWAVSTKTDLKCVLNRPDETWRSGWDVNFRYSKKGNGVVEEFKIHNDWYYHLILSGRKPYYKLKDYSWEFEVDRVKQIEYALSKLLIRARVNVTPINEINYDDLKINELN